MVIFVYIIHYKNKKCNSFFEKKRKILIKNYFLCLEKRVLFGEQTVLCPKKRKRNGKKYFFAENGRYFCEKHLDFPSEWWYNTKLCIK